MGYYTYYNLFVDAVSRDQNGKLVMRAIPAITKKDLEDEIEKLNVFVDGDCECGWDSDSVKWYDHDEDMLMLSYRFPDVLFTLHGDGEETEDMWYTYYLNGAMQEAPAVVTFDEFDESKLVKSDQQELFSFNRKYSYE